MANYYTQEKKDAAVAVYESEGLAAAHKASGICKTSIARWAAAAGVVTSHGEKTQAATEARQLRVEAKRAELRETLLDKAIDMAARMNEPHIDFKGANVEEVTFPKAPAAACQHYATSIGILIDKFRLENGESTSRSEVQLDDTANARQRLAQQLARVAERGGQSGDTSRPD